MEETRSMNEEVLRLRAEINDWKEKSRQATHYERMWEAEKEERERQTAGHDKEVQNMKEMVEDLQMRVKAKDGTIKETKS